MQSRHLFSHFCRSERHFSWAGRRIPRLFSIFLRAFFFPSIFLRAIASWKRLRRFAAVVLIQSPWSVLLKFIMLLLTEMKNRNSKLKKWFNLILKEINIHKFQFDYTLWFWWSNSNKWINYLKDSIKWMMNRFQVVVKENQLRNVQFGCIYDFDVWFLNLWQITLKDSMK